ncbi:hypothetical protein [Nostoc sp. ChiVER01]|uniref:hypothetical protein n=1 Tax=Nostoc sp. ChiVER01 TaxID=3075382 RepID=UPI002AD3F2C3|nr:hypothetical protein [Nostoc sp. ChiVER01]MDZ8224998.1 hypothetical protein [Nostoc sp. ChiVER01]
MDIFERSQSVRLEGLPSDRSYQLLLTIPQAVKSLNGKTKHLIQSGHKTRLYFLANHHTRR